MASSSGAQTDGASRALLFESLARVAQKIDQHLLQLSGVGVDEGKCRIQIDFHADFFCGKAKALQLRGAHHDLIQGDQTPLRNGFPGVEKELPEDGARTFCLLINPARFFRPAGGVLAHEQALRVTENAGERVAQFMGDAAHHLSECSQFFRLQQLRMEHALGGEVAVDFHAAQVPPDGVEHGPRGALENARRGTHHLQFLAHTTLDAPSECPPALGEASGFGGLPFEARDQSFQRLDFPGFPRGQTRDLLESRVHGAHVFLRVKQDNSFFQPFEDILQFGFGLFRRSPRFNRRRGLKQDREGLTRHARHQAQLHADSVLQFRLRRFLLRAIAGGRKIE